MLARLDHVRSDEAEAPRMGREGDRRSRQRQRTALIIVDMQNDFCPGGSLPVPGADKVASRISAWLRSRPDDYGLVVATMDWHPEASGDDPLPRFSPKSHHLATRPPHCVRHTYGAQLHANLSLPPGTVVVRKDQSSVARSGFEGHDARGVRLLDLLRRDGISAVDIVGLGADDRVAATALDAASGGLSVRLLLDLVAGFAPESSQHLLDETTRAAIIV